MTKNPMISNVMFEYEKDKDVSKFVELMKKLIYEEQDSSDEDLKKPVNVIEGVRIYYYLAIFAFRFSTAEKKEGKGRDG